MSETLTQYEDVSEWDEELRQWLAKHVATHPHHPTAVLARGQYIGVARRVLDSYIAGTYFLPKALGGEGVDPQNSKVENAIRAYRERVEGTVRHGYANTFVMSRAWELLKQACTIAIDENVIVVIYGRPGVGKTRCLMQFATQNMNTAPVSILCSRNITPLYFVQKLASDLKLTGKFKIAQYEDAIVEKLKRSPRPLFIDQANYLGEKSLGSLCYIWERACVPVVLVGTKDLFDLFTNSRLTEGVREQLSSRVAWHYLLPELTLEETKAIIERVLGADATDEAVAQIFNITGGIHRHVDMIIPRILQLKARHQKKLTDGKATMKDVITTAGSRLIIG